MFGSEMFSRRPNYSLTPVKIDLSNQDYATLHNKAILVLGVSEFVPAFDSSLEDSGCQIKHSTADGRCDLSDYVPTKLNSACERMLGVSAVGLAQNHVPSTPSWMAFLASLLSTTSLMGRVRKALELKEKYVPRTTADFDQSRADLISVMGTNKNSYGWMTRLAQTPNAVPGLPEGSAPVERLNALLTWVQVNVPGTLPDVAVYAPCTYEDASFWDLWREQTVIPYVQVVFNEQRTLDIEATLHEIIRVLGEQSSAE